MGVDVCADWQFEHVVIIGRMDDESGDMGR
jgi:hypothetical protein